jgi:N-acyl-D-amino-acid deacylase
VEFDFLIKNGTVVDGIGAPARRADVGIRNGKIEVVDLLPESTAAEVVDAGGKIVAPGFIDVHIHSETNLIDPNSQYRYGGVLQGVTTQLAGPDGFGWARLAQDDAKALFQSHIFAYGKTDLDFNWPHVEDYLQLFPGNSPANVMPQAPHCSIRFETMGWDARPASDDEIERMKPALREWMDAGASCLCLGIDYQPSAFATTHELIELSKVVGEYGGIYAAHQRYNEVGVEKAWWETVEIGEKSGIPVHVSHENVSDITAPILDASEERCDLTFESYLYPAGATDLTLMLPIWGSAGGPTAILERLKNPEIREQLRAHMQAALTIGKGTARIVFADNPHGRFIGEEIGDVAAKLGIEPGEFALQIIEEETPYSLMVYHRGTTPEYQREIIWDTVRHPKMLVASDGIYHGDFSHPRGYGCFSRVLRLAVREMGAVSLEEAVWKMTGYPAERFRIGDRGWLKPGMAADVVIFDQNTVADRATWNEPRLEPVGIDRVLVNGQAVVIDGTPTGLTPGQIVRRKG